VMNLQGCSADKEKKFWLKPKTGKTREI
jgi:hypothetical protein